MGRKKTGIMGGTFNPIHIGHLILAETARTEYELDEVLFIPSGVSYMKQGTEILSGEQRARMVDLAIADNPHFKLSLMEVRRAGNTYTYETLETLHGQNPDNEYFFILGADSLFAIQSWKYPERIFAACRLLVAVREQPDRQHSYRDEGLETEISLLREKYQAKIDLLACGNMEVSSTRIREMIRLGQSVRYLVPDKVIEYMKNEHLYRGELLWEKM